MPKNLLQDMVRVKYQPSSGAKETKVKKASPKKVLPVKKEYNTRSHFALWFVAIVSIIFLIFALSYLFLTAKITVNPKVQNIILNENLSASLDGNADSFSLVVLSGEENKTVQTAEEKEIIQKAEGVVVLYNTFSSASQVLNIDTKLEGSNRKIYKTKTRTVVPGQTLDGKPGSVEVKIYGAEGGEEYNSAPLDFKIVNFKGGPKYSKFYGRSKGEITGGLEGKFFFTPPDQKANLLNEMKTALKAKLLQKATDQIPNGFILFKDAAYLTVDESNIDVVYSKDNALPINLKGTLNGILFDVDKLSKKIAKDKIPTYDDSPVYMPNIQDLTFSLSAQAGFSSKDDISFKNIKNINFNLSGTVKIVWKVDADKLATDLLGRSKKDFSQILLQYPSIDSAELTISPIWKRSFPDKTKNIKVIVNYPK